MPARETDRQPGPLDWFGSEQALPVLSAECGRVVDLLGARARQPWLWVAPQAIPEPEKAPRGLFLYGDHAGFGGPFRCALPFPLPSEAFGSILVQHVHESGMEGLLAECARLLEPGGRLVLISLNPWSPYRARWRHSGLRVRGSLAWQADLKREGLTMLEERCRFGPAWRLRGAESRYAPSRLRAVVLLEAEKRTVALIPPRNVPRWGVGASPI